MKPIVLCFGLWLAVVSLASNQLDEDSVQEAKAWVQRAEQLMPAYSGEHRATLPEETRRRVLAAAHLLRAAHAMGEDTAESYRWLAHGEILLGEDRLHRGADATEHFVRALQALQEADQREANHVWTAYSRAVTLRRLDQPTAGLAAIEQAIHCDANRPEHHDSMQPRLLAWKAELQMDCFAFDAARETWRELYGHPEEVHWDLLWALVETHLRERNWDAAEHELQRGLAHREYSEYPQIYEALAYLAVLRGESQRASVHMERALARERSPLVDYRIGWVVVAEGAQRAAATRELEAFAAHPPAGLDGWGRLRVQLLTGQITPLEFERESLIESLRRAERGDPRRGLLCEAYFLLGLMYERRGNLTLARKAYQKALQEKRERFDWFWGLARMRFANLHSSVDLPWNSRWASQYSVATWRVTHRFGDGSLRQDDSPPRVRHGDLIQGMRPIELGEQRYEWVVLEKD